MRKIMVLVLAGPLLAGCLKGGEPAEVAEFVDAAGRTLGEAEPCAPVLAARATACARNVVATWPGGLSDGARLAALERLEAARLRAANPEACPAAVKTLRSSPLWERCYRPPSS